MDPKKISANNLKTTHRVQYLKRTPIFMLTVVASVVFLSYYLSQMQETEPFTQIDVLQPAKSFFVVERPVCKIPNLDPFNIDVMKYYVAKKPTICPGIRKITYQKENMLLLNSTALKAYCEGNYIQCEYSTLTRQGDDGFSYSKSVKFNDNIVVTSEFIRVICFCNGSQKNYTNFHAFVHARSTAKTVSKVAGKTNRRMIINETETKTYNKTRFNVLMVGLDSISRLNSHRQLSGTRAFLMYTLGAVELNGYNKVAANTFVNMMPLLYGKYIKDIPWPPRVKTTFDSYDLLWYKYRRFGYKTAFAEDWPAIAMFNDVRPGFSKPPTDHYFRPIALAMKNESSIWTLGYRCVKDRLKEEMYLQYIFDFAKIYKARSHFAFTFLSRLSHDGFNDVGTADHTFRKFFKKLHEEQLLNDTFLFFFSDHGIRFGEFRKTLRGKKEDRLPMMYIVAPKWFPKKFPRLWLNLKTNSQRLTTAFDVHETLLALLNLEDFERNLSKIDISRRGISLFAEIPINRTCEMATILKHWCSCLQTKTLPVHNKAVVNVASLVVAYINEIVKSDNKCALLKLDKIIRASLILPNGNYRNYERFENHNVDEIGVNYNKPNQIKISEYQVTFTTLPGQSFFETTVRYNPLNNKIEILGGISRTDMYGHKIKCYSKLEVKEFCYCT